LEARYEALSSGQRLGSVDQTQRKLWFAATQVKLCHETECQKKAERVRDALR
jgi:hypothetical protein